MKIVGQNKDHPQSEAITNWLGLIAFGAMLLPWIAIAIGCVTLGVGAIFRGDRELIVCLPAGIALLLLPTLLVYLAGLWYAPISGFELDGSMFTYTLDRKSDAKKRSIDDIRWLDHRMRRGHTRGYVIKFTDGCGIYVPRSLDKSDELAQAVKASIKNR
jgi:hypothetical protein